MLDPLDDWIARSASDRMVDEIAAAASVAELDHLAEEARRDHAGHPKFAELEMILGAKRRLLSGRCPEHSSPDHSEP